MDQSESEGKEGFPIFIGAASTDVAINPPRLSRWKETQLAKREETLEAKANKETEKERRRQTDLEGEWATDRKDNICSELPAATI